MNNDESFRCLKMSKDYYTKKDLENALKFAQKAFQMNPCKETEMWLDRMNVDARPSYTQEQVNLVKAFQDRVGGKHADLYIILDISKTSSDSDIKKAYRKNALFFHPDKNTAPGSEECFKLISKAFSILSDPEQRKKYDLYGSEDETSFHANRHHFTARNFQYDVDPEEIFRVFFGNNNPFFFTNNSPFVQAGDGEFYTANFGDFTRNAFSSFARHNFNRAQQRPNDFSGLWPLFKKLAPALLFIFISLLSSWYSSYSSTKTARSMVKRSVSFDRNDTYYFHRLIIPRFLRAAISIPYWVDSDFQHNFFRAGWNSNGDIVHEDYSSYKKYVEPAIKAQYIKYLQEKCRKQKEIQQSRIQTAIRTKDQSLAEQIRKEKMEFCEKLYEIGG